MAACLGKGREMLPGSGLCAIRPVLGSQYLVGLWWVFCRSWTLALCVDVWVGVWVGRARTPNMATSPTLPLGLEVGMAPFLYIFGRC